MRPAYARRRAAVGATRPVTTGHPDLSAPAQDAFTWAMAIVSMPTAFQVRPIGPDDRDALTAFYGGLSPDSLEARFHGAGPGVAGTVATRFCGPDHEHREGIVAIVTGDTGRPVVIGHLCLEPSTPGEVEMAIAVADAWHRRGVGRALLAAGIAWARRHGLARMRASMRADNAAVIGLVRSMGLPVWFDWADGGVVEVVIPLDVEVPRAA